MGSPSWEPGGASWQPYAEAIERAGGEPVPLGPSARGREAAVLAELDGILFSGGKDVDLRLFPNPPDLRGDDPERVMERCRMRPEPERDGYELPLLQEALQRDLPLLGICRGCQVLNVGLGGRLILDIELETETAVVHTTQPAPDGGSSFHALRIERGTLLAGSLAPEAFSRCNSRHHQAVLVDETFTARVAAVSPDDGIVEAIEVPGRRWAIGVQWHPEHPRDPEVRRASEPLFRAFVEAASG